MVLMYKPKPKAEFVHFLVKVVFLHRLLEGHLKLPFSIKIIPHCFNKVEVWDLGKSMADSVSLCVRVCFYCNGIVFRIIFMLKCEAVGNQMPSR